MKTKTILLMAFLFEILFAQAEMTIELATQTVNFQNKTVKFTMEAIGQVWAGSAGGSSWLTNDYQFAKEEIEPPGNHTGCTRGFNQCWQVGGSYDKYGFGFYKFTIYDGVNDEFQMRKYFYLDFRGRGYNDLTVRFDNNTNSAGIHQGLSCSIGVWNPVFDNIQNGSIIGIWEIYGQTYANTTPFPEFWEHCLNVLESTNNHPLLVWGDYPVDKDISTIFHYSIDRKNGGLDWETDIAQTSATECIYEDVDFTMPVSSSHTLYYRVRAVKSESPATLYTGYTNTASISVNGYDPGKKNVYNGLVFTFNLNQNYPNPFNPSTIIYYSIPLEVSGSRVILKVYDLMGREAAELVNEVKSSGRYSVNFDASGLSSGIYLYRIQAGSYSITKKMNLLK